VPAPLYHETVTSIGQGRSRRSLEPLVRPPALRPGDAIGLAALSGPVPEDRLEAGIGYLCKRGYRVIEASNLRSRTQYLAGSDQERAAGYHGLLENPAVRAIFLARGGYGVTRVIPRLEAGLIRKRPLIHLGHSDATALFAFLRAHAGLVAFHGPMVAVDFARNPPDPPTDAGWEPVLRGEPGAGRFPILPEQVIAAGRAEGVLTGGCLSLLVALEGTPESVATDDAILFWEDAGEEVYRVDRMLTQWKRSGKFDRVRGVMIGKLTGITREGQPNEAALTALLCDFFGEAPYPVVRDLPLGHGGRNLTVPLGVRARLDTERGFELLEPGVS
jgi:muramoyltetrapeptide carboxypeptidase